MTNTGFGRYIGQGFGILVVVGALMLLDWLCG